MGKRAILVGKQSTSLAVRDPQPHPNFVVDPTDEPSAEWGWHGTWPRATRIAGWLTAISMFVMLIGNHRGRVEDLWLVFVGVVIVAALVRDAVKSRTAWKR